MNQLHLYLDHDFRKLTKLVFTIFGPLQNFILHLQVTLEAKLKNHFRKSERGSGNYSVQRPKRHTREKPSAQQAGPLAARGGKPTRSALTTLDYIHFAAVGF
jgi:hypothetical protein